jgi:hypothetical protein
MNSGAAIACDAVGDAGKLPCPIRVWGLAARMFWFLSFGSGVELNDVLGSGRFDCGGDVGDPQK